MRHHVKHARPGWRLTLITPTVRHSGDVALDRQRIHDGWEAVRKWLHRYLGKDQWQFFHAMMVWEVTPGRRRDGHVHAHVFCLLPWVPFDRLRAVYMRATDGEGQRIDIRSRPKKRGARGYSVGGAVGYLAKYVSKGVELGGFPPKLAAAVTAAFYQKRLQNPTHRFYTTPLERRCPKCSERHCRVAAGWEETAGDSLLSPALRELLYLDAPVARPPPASRGSRAAAPAVGAGGASEEW